MNRLMSYSDLVQIIPISKDYARKLVSEKKIPFVKIGRRVFFEQEAIEKWIADHRATTGKEAE